MLTALLALARLRRTKTTALQVLQTQGLATRPAARKRSRTPTSGLLLHPGLTSPELHLGRRRKKLIFLLQVSGFHLFPAEATKQGGEEERGAWATPGAHPPPRPHRLHLSIFYKWVLLAKFFLFRGSLRYSPMYNLNPYIHLKWVGLCGNSVLWYKDPPSSPFPAHHRTLAP